MTSRLIPTALALSLLCTSALAEDAYLVTMGDLGQQSDGLYEVRSPLPPGPPPSAAHLPPDRIDAAAQALREGLRMQSSAGFGAFLYDNRDRGHSSLPQDTFPALRHVTYGIDATARGVDRGIVSQLLFPAPTIGNASLAYTGRPQSRSLPRQAMIDARLARRMAHLYSQNHLYVFPEHRDHDAVDRFPANWPYTVISQGSSGSDRPFVEALAMSLAALPTEVFADLRDRGLIAPTLQYLLRRNLRGVASDADYLSPNAHPPVFRSADLDLAAMVRHAMRLEPSDIVPPPRLRVAEEDFTDRAGLAQMSERLFDTDHAIARVWRSLEGERRIAVSVEGSGDEATRFHWRVVRGDPEHVRLEPSDDSGRSASIAVTWHDPLVDGWPPDSDSSAPLTPRIDIAVIADNGTGLSAPSFVSILLPAHQVRNYGRTPDGTPRLHSVDYAPDLSRIPVFDPFLYWRADWEDVAIRDDDDRPAWERTFKDGSVAIVPETGVTYERIGALRNILAVTGE